MVRYLFLFDKVVIVCKRKGYSYELKEVIELLFHKMSDDPMHNKDIKKVGAGLERGRRRFLIPGRERQAEIEVVDLAELCLSFAIVSVADGSLGGW